MARIHLMQSTWRPSTPTCPAGRLGLPALRQQVQMTMHVTCWRQVPWWKGADSTECKVSFLYFLMQRLRPHSQQVQSGDVALRRSWQWGHPTCKGPEGLVDARQSLAILSVDPLGLLPPARMTASTKPGTRASATCTPFSGIACCARVHVLVARAVTCNRWQTLARVRDCAPGESASLSMTHTHEHRHLPGAANLRC